MIVTTPNGKLINCTFPLALPAREVSRVEIEREDVTLMLRTFERNPAQLRKQLAALENALKD